jgi:uncharacterized Fe-S center protein
MAKPKVYFLSLDRVAEIADAAANAGLTDIVKGGDFVAIKMHFGEKGNVGYVNPKLVKPLVPMLKTLKAHPFFTDANTIYRGERADSVHHLMVAAEHDFHPKFLGAPVVIADGLRGTGEVVVDVGLKHFKKVKVAEAIHHSDVILSVAHFKGHELCGFGGAIKNLGMGCASKSGKYEQHNNFVPKVDASKCTVCGVCVKWCAGGALTLPPLLRKEGKGKVGGTIQLDPKKCIGCGQCILSCEQKVFGIPWNEDANIVQEKIAEYAFGVVKGKRTFFINFLTHITSYCDCFRSHKKPIMPDIGILLSADPVAVDQACVDLIKKHAGHDILKESTGADGSVQIAYAEKLGIGNRGYELVTIKSRQ